MSWKFQRTLILSGIFVFTLFLTFVTTPTHSSFDCQRTPSAVTEFCVFTTEYYLGAYKSRESIWGIKSAIPIQYSVFRARGHSPNYTGIYVKGKDSNHISIKNQEDKNVATEIEQINYFRDHSDMTDLHLIQNDPLGSSAFEIFFALFSFLIFMDYRAQKY